MTTIQLSETVSLVCAKLHWSIDYATKVNTNHHLSKNEERESVDHYGDLSRLIPKLNQYDVDVAVVKKIRNAYVGCLRELKAITTSEEFDFSNKIKWTVTQGIFTHTVKTNKDHRGILVNMEYNTEHHKSEGIAKFEFTAPSHYKAAEMLLNKTLMNVLTTDKVDDFIDHMKHETMLIANASQNYDKK